MADANSQSQDLQSLLSSAERDFLVRNNGHQVKISELSGKTIGLYFSASWCGPCRVFTPKLIQVYNDLSAKNDFEVVFFSADEDEESFNGYFSEMPWLAIPFSDSETRDRLDELFEVNGIPHLVIIDENGKVLTDDGVGMVGEYGAEGHPFTEERMKLLKEEEEKASKEQTLESLLVSPSRDFLISKDGNKVPVSELVGKNILLYFSAHWCSPCRAFLPKLIKAYHEIKAKDDGFEVIFISSDRDQASFEEFFSGMPWLALPFGDEKKFLSRTFKVIRIPTVLAIGASGKIVTDQARQLLMTHGAKAYPFTAERLKEIEAEFEEMAKGWPENLKSALHEEHELKLSRHKNYICDGCNEEGEGWSFNCLECDYDLHPKCALVKDEDVQQENVDGGHKEDSKEGWICDGAVCYKA